MTASSAGLDRRRFLVASGAVAVGALVGLGAAACSEDEAARGDGLAGLFPDQVGAVAGIGAAALATGTPADVAAARAALPTDGLEVGADGVRLLDPAAFAVAYQQAQAAELADGRLSPVSGYLFTPTELAVAVVVHDEAG